MKQPTSDKFVGLLSVEIQIEFLSDSNLVENHQTISFAGVYDYWMIMSHTLKAQEVVTFVMEFLSHNKLKLSSGSRSGMEVINGLRYGFLCGSGCSLLTILQATGSCSLVYVVSCCA